MGNPKIWPSTERRCHDPVLLQYVRYTQSVSILCSIASSTNQKPDPSDEDSIESLLMESRANLASRIDVLVTDPFACTIQSVRRFHIVCTYLVEI
jgi:hypothetical protein